MENNIENNIATMSKLVGDAVAFFPEDIALLLNTNGVTIDAQNYNTDQLVGAVIDGLYSSESFKIAFFTFLASKNEFLNATGSNTSSYVDSGVRVFSVIAGGVSAKKDREALLQQSKIQAEASKDQVEIARINAQIEASKLDFLKNKPADGKSNTGLYIGLGVGGVLVLGLVVYFVVKK
jgi:hypothetical protein